MSKKGNKFNDAFQSDCQPCSGPPEKAVECVKEKITVWNRLANYSIHLMLATQQGQDVASFFFPMESLKVIG